MNLKSLLLDSRLRVTFVLLVIWLITIWNFRSFDSFFYPLFAVSLMVIADTSITYLRTRKYYRPFSSLVSGFLIGFIISPSSPLWIVAIAVLVASVAKQFLAVGIRQHIFNPAALGIMGVNLAFGTPVAWWAVAWGMLPAYVLLFGMPYILFKVRRLLTSLSFVAVYSVYLFSILPPSNILRLLIDSSFLLFVLVMLPEPITSTNRGLFKYLFGPLVAILAIGLSYTRILSDVFLPALLFANLISFLTLRLTMSAKTRTV